MGFGHLSLARRLYFRSGMPRSLLARPFLASLAGVALLGVACIDPGYPELPEPPTTPIEIAPLAPHAVIATGGVQGFAIDDATSIGLSGDASAGYRVEPAGKVWPNLVQPLYYVRAFESGLGSFEIITNRGIATGLVESAEVASLALVPADYELDGSSRFAVDLNRREVVVELRDAAGRRLVDLSLGIPAQQTGWDRAILPARAARHVVAVYADSFGERGLAIDVVAAVDRIESRVAGDRICFHAYAGAIEVATAMTIRGGTPVPGAANCATGDPTSISAHRAE
jgi:hypothetical protein